jgi:hypothetical protein
MTNPSNQNGALIPVKGRGSNAAVDKFAELNDVVGRWFFKPDLQAFRVILRTIKSHYLNIGDPPWLFIVAPPGTGKTTTGIMGTAGLPEVVSLGGFTANTLLSGFHGYKEPGLLERLGQTKEVSGTFTTKGNGILLVKDFTTVLSMRRETRSEILSQLREVHDGEFRKSFGTGETKIWRGRITIVAAVTPIIDQFYSIFTVLGERFLQLRWHRPESPVAGQRAIQQQGSELLIRRQLRAAVNALFAASSDSPPTMSSQAERRLASLAELVAIARTHVFRGSYGNREIEYVPEPEANTRISKGLAAIAKGIAALNRRRTVAEQDIQDSFRVAIDCMSENRRRVLIPIAQGRRPENFRLPRTVADRQIEELQELGLITQRPYALTETAAQLLEVADVVWQGVQSVK